jgi:hypothetical protein
VGKEGVVLLPCKITAESPYSPAEWAKIEKLAVAKGKVYKDIKKAKKHIEAL